jgi:hypothetical protein
VFVPCKPFQPNLILGGEARSLPKSGASKRCPTLGRLRTRLGRLGRDERSSLWGWFVNYVCKKFYKNGPWSFSTICASPSAAVLLNVIKRFWPEFTLWGNKLERFDIVKLSSVVSLWLVRQTYSKKTDSIG